MHRPALQIGVLPSLGTEGGTPPLWSRWDGFFPLKPVVCSGGTCSPLLQFLLVHCKLSKKVYKLNEEDCSEQGRREGMCVCTEDIDGQQLQVSVFLFLSSIFSAAPHQDSSQLLTKIRWGGALMEQQLMQCLFHISISSQL